MKFENILQAIFSAPAILLDVIVSGFRSFFIQEKELLQNIMAAAKQILCMIMV